MILSAKYTENIPIVELCILRLIHLKDLFLMYGFCSYYLAYYSFSEIVTIQLFIRISTGT